MGVEDDAEEEGLGSAAVWMNVRYLKQGCNESSAIGSRAARRFSRKDSRINLPHERQNEFPEIGGGGVAFLEGRPRLDFAEVMAAEWK